jgi:hypothetical protein
LVIADGYGNEQIVWQCHHQHGLALDAHECLRRNSPREFQRVVRT